MPGIPTIYYGSEWGEKADKSQGDPALRPCFDEPKWTDLTDVIASLCKARNGSKALSYGDFKICSETLWYSLDNVEPYSSPLVYEIDLVTHF